ESYRQRRGRSLYALDDRRWLLAVRRFYPNPPGLPDRPVHRRGQLSHPDRGAGRAGGLKPTLELSYSSSASDGINGERTGWQASWVGKGWSSAPAGAISLNRNLAGVAWDNFSVVFGGHSFDAIRGQLTNIAINGHACTNYVNDKPFYECWTWHPVD